MSSVLQVMDIHKQFSMIGTKGKEVLAAVDGVSFSVNKAERIGIIGASGCGKTTLLKIILGLLKADCGQVEKKGIPGFVSQDPYSSLCPRYKVKQIVSEPLIYRRTGLDKSEILRRTEDALHMVQLNPDIYLERYPYQLSGGERQRVSLARAVIMEPELLILDEPTSMLDYDVKKSIGENILKISVEKQMALVLVTHDIEFAKIICDRLYIMNEGKITEQGKTNALCENPSTEFTKMLFAASLNLEEFWKLKEQREQI